MPVLAPLTSVPPHWRHGVPPAVIDSAPPLSPSLSRQSVKASCLIERPSSASMLPSVISTTQPRAVVRPQSAPRAGLYHDIPSAAPLIGAPSSGCKPRWFVSRLSLSYTDDRVDFARYTGHATDGATQSKWTRDRMIAEILDEKRRQQRALATERARIDRKLGIRRAASPERGDALHNPRRAVLRFFASPDCRIFAESESVVAVRNADLDALIAVGGAELISRNGRTEPAFHALLRVINDQDQRFDKFADLIVAMRYARRQLEQQSSKDGDTENQKEYAGAEESKTNDDDSAEIRDRMAASEEPAAAATAMKAEASNESVQTPDHTEDQPKTHEVDANDTTAANSATNASAAGATCETESKGDTATNDADTVDAMNTALPEAGAHQRHSTLAATDAVKDAKPSLTADAVEQKLAELAEAELETETDDEQYNEQYEPEGQQESEAKQATGPGTSAAAEDANQ